MTTHLGRNPFSKKKPEPVSVKKVQPGFGANLSRTAEFLLVKLPAESFVLTLKTVMMVKSVFEKR